LSQDLQTVIDKEPDVMLFAEVFLLVTLPTKENIPTEKAGTIIKVMSLEPSSDTPLFIIVIDSRNDEYLFCPPLCRDSRDGAQRLRQVDVSIENEVWLMLCLTLDDDTR
jgi:hypothetical protein